MGCRAEGRGGEGAAATPPAEATAAKGLVRKDEPPLPSSLLPLPAHPRPQGGPLLPELRQGRPCSSPPIQRRQLGLARCSHSLAFRFLSIFFFFTVTLV